MIGSHPLWTGPTIPVVGRLDVTREELANGLFQGLRLAAVGLAFAVYALASTMTACSPAPAGRAGRRVAVALATRLLPVLERDARDLRVALRGRHVELGPVRLLSPLLAGSLERGLNVAEAMEARGYGRAGPHARAAAARGRASTAWRSPARSLIVVVALVALAHVDDLRFAYVARRAGRSTASR